MSAHSSILKNSPYIHKKMLAVRVQTLKNISRSQISSVRFSSTKIAMANDVHLSNKRIRTKIKMGKARPAIFHQFDTLVELSDGSVIRRRSQAPRDEMRMVSDQRNNPLWNPNAEIETADLDATGKVSKFKERFAQFEEDADSSSGDSLLEMMGQNVTEVQKGGRVFTKKRK